MTAIIRTLGVFERALFISDQYAPFHIVSVLQLENAPAPEVLQQAWMHVQKRHPFLSAQLLQEHGKFYFAKLVDPDLPFQVLPRQNDEHWLEVAEAELEHRIDALTGPMFRCVYVYDESHSLAELVFSISHFIADASSVAHLMDELVTTCASLIDGEPVSAADLSPSPAVESRFPSAYRGVGLLFRTMRYTFGQMSDEIAYRIQSRGKRIPPVHKQPSRGHVLSLQLPDELIDPLAQRARREGVTLNSVLNTALVLAVNQHLYAGAALPMRTFIFADLRPYVQPPLTIENLAAYISMLRLTVSVKEDDFWSLARALHGKVYASLKSGDKFIAATMAESLLKMVTKYRAFRMGATALNYNGVAPIQTNYGNIRVKGVHGFVSAFDLGPELASQAQLFNDQLFWDFIYLEADMDRDKALIIVAEIERILKSVI